MQLSFSLLLASIVAIGWCPNAALVEAAALGRNPGMVSLPLKRVPEREGIHPLVVSAAPPFCRSYLSLTHQLDRRCFNSTLIADTDGLRG
jgi:hypothetical protein